jgi:ATP-binding cassette subfamily C protein LapB
MREALAKLQGRFAANRDAAPRADDPRPRTKASAIAFGRLPASAPQADLRQLAAAWGLIPAGEASDPQGLAGVRHGAGGPSPGPAALGLAAEALGLQATFVSKRVSALKGDDLPCLVLIREAESCLVVGRPAPDRLTVLSQGRTVEIAASELAEAANGTLALLRPLAQDAIGRRAGEAQPGPSAAAPNGASAEEARLRAASVVRAHVREALAGQGPLLRQLILASLLINILGLFLPLFSMAIFDRVIPHAAFETLWALALGACLALAVEFALRAARLKLFDAAGLTMSAGLQGRVVGRLLGARSADLPSGSGAVIQPLQDLDGMANLAPQLAVSLIVDIPFFLALIVLIGSIAGPIALVPLAGTLLLVAVHVLCHRLAKRSQGEHGSLQRRTQQLVIDSLSAQERIRVTASAGSMLARWDMACDGAGYALHRTRYWHGIAAQAAAAIVQAVIVGTLVWGVFRIDAAAMTIGALSAAMLLANRAMTPVSIATGLIFRAVQLAEQAAPIGALLAAPLEAGGDRRADGRDAIAGKLDLGAVTVQHPGDARDALRDVTLSIAAGERVGVIGKSGCGKSTLLRLLVRLVEPAKGAVRLDDRDIRHYDPATLRAAIACMPQDSALVDGSLEENLTAGLDRVDPVRFAAVARLTGVDEIARSHPQGYSLRVGPGGQRLSGGERQLVSLARALMGDPAMLLLDEPTAALDNAAEARLIAELRDLPASCGMVVATHRMQVLSLVDRVIWLDGGRVVADGPKADIFRKFGIAA